MGRGEVVCYFVSSDQEPRKLPVSQPSPGHSAARLAVTSRPTPRASQSPRGRRGLPHAFVYSQLLSVFPPKIPPFPSLSPFPYFLYPLIECGRGGESEASLSSAPALVVDAHHTFSGFYELEKNSYKKKFYTYHHDFLT